MINFELTHDDAAFLREQLATRLRQVETELVHTDQRALKADIARDLERLEHLHGRLAHVIGLAESPVAV